MWTTVGKKFKQQCGWEPLQEARERKAFNKHWLNTFKTLCLAALKIEVSENYKLILFPSPPFFGLLFSITLFCLPAASLINHPASSTQNNLSFFSATSRFFNVLLFPFHLSHVTVPDDGYIFLVSFTEWLAVALRIVSPLHWLCNLLECTASPQETVYQIERMIWIVADGMGGDKPVHEILIVKVFPGRINMKCCENRSPIFLSFRQLASENSRSCFLENSDHSLIIARDMMVDNNTFRGAKRSWWETGDIGSRFFISYYQRWWLRSSHFGSDPSSQRNPLCNCTAGYFRAENEQLAWQHI